jgi:pilus assembly protein CpaC
MAQVATDPIVLRPAGPENLQANQAVHVLVGHSVVIRTDPRLTRVLIGNPAVVTTTTTAANEVVVTATAPGSSSVVLWQENNESRIVEVVADLDVSMLRAATARAFPNESIRVEAEEGRVLLTGTASSVAVADQLVMLVAQFS